MAIGQTVIADTMAGGLPGSLADASYIKDGLSRTSEEVEDEIPFGVMVARGADDNGVLLLAATDDVLEGIVLRTDDFAKDVELGAVGLKPGVTMTVLNKGKIRVIVEEAVTPDSAVFVRAVATGVEVPGQFRDTADGTDCINISDWARFRTTTGAGGVAVLDFDLTTSRAADAT